jgi:amino acid transporter
LIGVALLLIGMMFSPHTHFSNMQPLFKPGISYWSAIIAIVAIAPWAYVGFDSIPQAAEEFDFAPKKAFSLIVLALVFAGFEYSAMIMVTAMGGPWQDLASQNPLWGTGDTVTGTLGNLGLFVLAVSLCMGIFTGLNGFYLSSSRLLFAMGRSKILPKPFSKLHEKYKTPHISVIFVAVLCFIAPWFGRSALNWVVNMSSAGVAVAYLYCCLDAFKGFKWSAQSKNNGRAVAPVKKTLALLGSFFCIGFLVLLLVPGSPAFMGVQAVIALVIWILLGIAFYFVRKRVFHEIPKEEMDYMILGEIRGTKEESEVVISGQSPSTNLPGE